MLAIGALLEGACRKGSELCSYSGGTVAVGHAASLFPCTWVHTWCPARCGNFFSGVVVALLRCQAIGRDVLTFTVLACHVVPNGCMAAQVRAGEPVSQYDVVKFAQLFNDELTLDNLERIHLVNLCRFVGIQPFGTDAFLVCMLRLSSVCPVKAVLAVWLYAGCRALGTSAFVMATVREGLLEGCSSPLTAEGSSACLAVITR